jgi:ApaG protein
MLISLLHKPTRTASEERAAADAARPCRPAEGGIAVSEIFTHLLHNPNPYPIPHPTKQTFWPITRLRVCCGEIQQSIKVLMYSSETHSILVTVEPRFLEQESDIANNRYFWAYHVTIENHSSIEVQLLTRYWHITDGVGRVEEVRGDGVVGETPLLSPSGKFEYTSGCPLATPSGFMRGSYQMIDQNGDMLEVEIPTFSLDMPDQRVTLN